MQARALHSQACMETLGQDLRYALRTMLMRKGFATVAVLTLGLGIGATTAIFTVVRGVLLRPLAFPDPEQLVAIWEVDRQDPAPDLGGEVSHLNFLDMQAEAGALSAMSMFRTTNVTLTGLGSAELIAAGATDANFFDAFGAHPILGRAFVEEETRPGGANVVVVSNGFWRERLGSSPNVIGRTLEIGGLSYEVIGVAPEGFDYPADSRLWVAAKFDDEGCSRGCALFEAVGRLAPDATVERARVELRTIMARLESEFPESNTEVTVELATLQNVFVGDVRGALLLLLGAVGLLLVIACANVANLFLARASTRSDEVAVRAALGANRSRLIRQLMTESLAFAVAGAVFGLLLALWSVDALRVWGPAELPRLENVGIDATTIAFAAAVASATILIFGLAPAVQLARQPLAGALRADARRHASVRGVRWGQSVLLTAQVALSAVLLLGAGLMARSLYRLGTVDPGYDVNGVTQIRLSLPSARYSEDDAVRTMAQLRDRVAAAPGIDATAIMAAPPLGNVDLSSDFVYVGRPQPAAGQEPTYQYRIVGPGALDLLGIAIVAGRDFLPSDRQGALPVALISQATADRYFPDTDPIGARVQLQISAGYPEDEPRTIVGVFNDVRSVELAQAPRPELWIPFAQSGAAFPSLLVRTSDPEAPSPLPIVRSALTDIDPDLPLIAPGPMSDWVNSQLATRRFFLVLIGLFTLMAVLLAAVGIFGVVTFVVERRLREIGVRMALGADTRRVIRMVLRQGLAPAAVGIAIGTGAGIALGRVLSSVLYETVSTDPLALLGTPLLLAAIAVTACARPALRAARVPPADTLRGGG